MRFLSWLNRYGEAATLSVITGSACPCMSYKGRDSYSEQYHRDNPSAADCGGTGLISSTTTTTNIKAIFSPPGLVGTSIPGGREFIESIGEVQADDLLLWGTVDTSDGSFETLAGYTDYNAYITYDSKKYFIRDVSSIPGQVGQVALLKHRTT